MLELNDCSMPMLKMLREAFIRKKMKYIGPLPIARIGIFVFSPQLFLPSSASTQLNSNQTKTECQPYFHLDPAPHPATHLEQKITHGYFKIIQDYFKDASRLIQGYRVPKKKCDLLYAQYLRQIKHKSGWFVVHFKDGVHSFVWSTQTFLCDIREPRCKQNNIGYQI